MELGIWLDDNENSRARYIKSIKTNLGIDLMFFKIDDAASATNLQDSLMNLNETPVVFFIDHFLMESALMNRGFSWCGIIKAKWFNIPIIGVSSADIASIPQSQKDEYTSFFEAKNLPTSLSKVTSIINGFQELKSNRKHKDYISFLNVPKDDVISLKKCIPIELLAKDENVNMHKIYKWVSDVLLKRAGFLYDSKWAATSIGLEEDVFIRKIVPHISKVEYNGIFADTNNKRWWRTALWEYVIKTAKSKNAEPIMKLGEKLPNIEFKKDRAICSVCKEPYPDIVAFEDKTERRRVPAHRRCCTEQDRDQELFFEPIYLVDGAE